MKRHAIWPRLTDWRATNGFTWGALPNLLRQQANMGEFRFGQAVAISRNFLEAGPAENDHTLPDRLDCSLVFQNVQSVSDAGPPHPKHHRQEFVRQGDLIALNPIMRH